MGSDELTLELRRELPAVPSTVFAALTDAKELARWWGPSGFTIPSLEFDPRVGESYRIEMKPPEGESFRLNGEFREVDPPRWLAFTFLWDPPDPDDLETLVAKLAEPAPAAAISGQVSRFMLNGLRLPTPVKDTNDIWRATGPMDGSTKSGMAE